MSQVLESIVLSYSFNSPVIWAYLLKMRKIAVLRSYMTFPPRGKALSGHYMIFLSFRVIGLALKYLKKERGRKEIG